MTLTGAEAIWASFRHRHRGAHYLKAAKKDLAERHRNDLIVTQICRLMQQLGPTTCLLSRTAEETVTPLQRRKTWGARTDQLQTKAALDKPTTFLAQVDTRKHGKSRFHYQFGAGLGMTNAAVHIECRPQG